MTVMADPIKRYKVELTIPECGGRSDRTITAEAYRWELESVIFLDAQGERVCEINARYVVSVQLRGQPGRMGEAERAG